MTSIGDVELRSIVKFCVALEKSSTETMKMINSTGKYKKCSPATVYRWHAPFKEGRNSIEDDRRCGRQSVVVCSIKDSVKDMINCDRRTTVRAIADELCVSVSTLHGILISGSADTGNASKLQVTTLKRCDDRWTLTSHNVANDVGVLRVFVIWLFTIFIMF